MTNVNVKIEFIPGNTKKWNTHAEQSASFGKISSNYWSKMWSCYDTIRYDILFGLKN